jgi:hypothetical protein
MPEVSNRGKRCAAPEITVNEAISEVLIGKPSLDISHFNKCIGDYA